MDAQLQTVERLVWVVAPSTNTPYEFGRWMGASEMRANAALWYANTTAMIDYLAGWLETHTAQDDARTAAQGLFDQLTQTDGMTFQEWRYGA